MSGQLKERLRQVQCVLAIVEVVSLVDDLCLSFSFIEALTHAFDAVVEPFLDRWVEALKLSKEFLCLLGVAGAVHHWS